MTDKLRQAAQQMLEAVADLTILTPREWQAVHGLKIDALRAALAEQPQEPSAGGVLFAVEEAIRNGDCPWQIEQAFDEYEGKRRNNSTKD